MKLFKEVIKNNLKMIIFYVIIGIIISFLDLYTVTYYQKILDSFQYKSLTIYPLIIYAVLLVVSTILGYIENCPEQQVKNKLYLDFKLQSLKKMKTIDYLEYQKLGTGRLTQKIEDGSTASRDVIVGFWLKTFRYLLPTALFSLVFIFSVKKEFVLFVFAGYVIVILVSNLILNVHIIAVFASFKPSSNVTSYIHPSLYSTFNLFLKVEYKSLGSTPIT